MKGRRTDLSLREIEVISLLAHGSTYKEICAHLNLKHSTIRTHISNAIDVLQARDGTSAVLAYLRSPQRVASAAENLHDAHGSLSPGGWRLVVRYVLDELLGSVPDDVPDVLEELPLPPSPRPAPGDMCSDCGEDPAGPGSLCGFCWAEQLERDAA